MEEYFDNVVAFNTALADGLVKAYEDGYEQGKKDAMQWVSVKVRLPERTGRYLTWTGKTRAVCTFFLDSNLWIIRKDDLVTDCDEVTHWMELPAPPEGV